MNDVTCAINELYYSIINDIVFNVSNKEIKFDLTLIDNGNRTRHSMQFKNVTSFMWLEKPEGRDLYCYSDCHYYEITSIILKKISTNTENDWLKQYPMDYNVAIEVWETALLINATELSIDSLQFSISK